MPTVEFKVENKIGVLQVARPQALNALNAEVLQELDAILTKISTMGSSEVRVLIVTGVGEKAFVAGADIKEINQLNPETAQKFALRGQNVFRKMEKLGIPVIALVNGFALGGGLELALSCDFIYASENAKLGLPEVSLGLIPGFGGTVRLSRVVGKARAKEMILTGNPLSAADAMLVGLVNQVFPSQNLMSEGLRTAQVIASRGPRALANAKRSVDQTYDLDLDSAFVLEAKLFSDLFTGSDVQEGTTAFIEKRKPEFKGL